ncbi:hypothetical protein NPIL_609701 [Nephila pilipes]|uniref:glycerophosphocholine cholinephosphodiesterase n=1 Tax=Nephila pilipes TaxID=299642 RepID=A0A8X6QUQ6_NEPPI|nr:hypothetical protein NPIL_609701 [Nephila pilipes]
MEVKFAFIGIFCVFFLHCFCEVKAAKKLIVVLIDGVRWDYINDSNLKGFRQMIDNGVKAPYVVPIFPSLSYPNWQALTTGCFETLRKKFIWRQKTSKQFLFTIHRRSASYE